MVRPEGKTAAACRHLGSDERGAIVLEYTVLLGTVAMLCAVAVAGLGPALVKGYEHTRNVLVAPVP